MKEFVVSLRCSPFPDGRLVVAKDSKLDLDRAQSAIVVPPIIG